jgi:hypothetical protein
MRQRRRERAEQDRQQGDPGAQRMSNNSGHAQSIPETKASLGTARLHHTITPIP